MGIVDVAIRDGENIVKLEAFADRILEFKENSLYVINISDNIEFLEDTYRNKGCAYDYHVVRTDQGIAWFNIHGVYLYDGKQVHNLLEKGGIRIINETDWEAFITDGVDGSADDADMGSAQIGYIPKKRQILIKNENNDVYLYDFILRAWTSGLSRVSETSHMTNFALSADHDLFYIDDVDADINTWQTSPQSSTGFLYETPDIDFGEPGVRKKIHKVYVTYKGASATNVAVDYDVGGGTTFPYDFVDGTNFTSTKLDGSSSWAVAELKPDTSSEANNIKSFQLRFQASGTGAEITKVECVADSSDSLNGKYFDIYGAGGKTEVWIDTDNSGTSAPSGSGSYAQTIEVTEIETDDTANSVAIAVAAAVDDHANFGCEVQGSTVYITDAASASRTDASDGDTGFAISVERQGGTTSVPADFEINDITIVYRMKNIK
jgi:hypothetical protein